MYVAGKVGEIVVIRGELPRICGNSRGITLKKRRDKNCLEVGVHPDGNSQRITLTN